MFASTRATACLVAAGLTTMADPEAAPMRSSPRIYAGPTSVTASPHHERSAVRASDPVETSKPPAPTVEPLSPFRVRPVLDATLTLGAAAPAIVLGAWVERSLPIRTPAPQADAEIGRFDRVALGRFAQRPAIASDVLLAVGLAAPLVYHGVEAGLPQRGWSEARGRGSWVRFGIDLLIYTQALAFNSLFTEVLKSAIGRPRPFTYLDPAQVDPASRSELEQAQQRFNADRSFPSGHTTMAFAASTAGATLLTIELLGRSRWAIATAWVGGTAVATTTAAMRVVAGYHFPSDVVASAFLGAAVGAIVPLAHWSPLPATNTVRPRRARRLHQRGSFPKRWAVAPLHDPYARGIQIWGLL